MTSDHFSGHARQYAQHRPDYPPALFAWLAAQCRRHRLAWDCGTGNGQAALALAAHFDHVHATDLSSAQLSQASTHSKVSYLAAPAQSSGLDDGSVDMVTVAQALHWFDHDAFYAEVARVLQPGGLLAAWTYCLLETEPEVTTLVAEFHGQTVGPWWPPQRRWVDTGYRDLPFPFEEVAAPTFVMEREWTLAQLLDYLRTWSATQRYIAEQSHDPTLDLALRLQAVWGDPAVTKTIRWPLAMRCGRSYS